MKIKNIKKGFTIIEMLVVIIVIGVLLAMGIRSYVRFQGTSEHNTALSQFESMVQTVQNNARNNVPSKSKQISDLTDPYKKNFMGYLIEFKYYDSNNPDLGSSYEIRYCEKSGNNYNCSILEPKQDIFVRNLYIEASNDSQKKCKGIFFESLSGDLMILDETVNNVNDFDPNNLIDLGNANEIECAVHIKSELSDDYDAEYVFKSDTNEFSRKK